MKKIILLVVLSLCFARAQAEPELKGTPAELSAFLTSVPKTVTVTGEAEMKIPADRALISLNVVTESKSLQDASRENQELRGRILRTLTERGIPAERIKASKFSSTPQYGMFKEKAKSYRVEMSSKSPRTTKRNFKSLPASWTVLKRFVTRRSNSNIRRKIS